jgi:hypothetical protein
MNSRVNQKLCSKCKKQKPNEEFHKNNNSPDGLTCWCKECHRDSARQWRSNNKEQRDEYNKNWRSANMDRVRASGKKAAAKRRVEKPELTLFYGASHRAKKAGIEFDLTIEDVIIPDRCPLLGVKLKPGAGKAHPNSPSLDKVDPSGGYTKGNVWVISYRANQIKNDATADELLLIGHTLKSIEFNGTKIQNKPSKKEI